MRRAPTVVATTVLALAVASAAGAAPGFVEDDLVVIDRLVGEQANGWFGWVAANVGDLDGDGVDDLLVPAPGWDPAGAGGPTGAGKVTLYSGATRTVLAEHVGAATARLGYSAAPAGDVDADGVPDYVAGAPGALASQPGRVVVWSGADHEALLDLAGPTGALWGGSVSQAGDVDDDGHDDVLVGAKFAAGGRGSLEVRSGADGSRLWQVTGRRAGDNLGSAVGLVGDVDGDGVDDLSVGASGATRGGAGRGLAYVVSGVDGSIVHELRPRGDGQVFGEFFASGAGDVDGDGIGDVFVGDYNAGVPKRRTYPPGTGAAYVFSGATGQRLHRFAADSPGEGVGPGRGVGDVDGDGHADLVVAGYTSSAAAPIAGKAWVRSGRTGEVLQVMTSTTAGEAFGVDALGLGDVDGDGRTDFVVTAVGLSFSGIAPGTTYLVAGTTG